MERFAHLVEKIYNKTKEGISLENLYTQVQALQIEMQQALASDAIKGSNKVNVTLPSCYTPRKQEENFSANYLKSEAASEQQVQEPAKETVKAVVTPVFSLVDDSYDDDETPDYYIRTSLKTSSENNTVESLTANEESAVMIAEASIGDLKRSISLNEKFIFINELFRGEESTYERSLATIQNFNNYTDADSWIKRELITKEGWKNDDEHVVYFMELVKRRFAS